MNALAKANLLAAQLLATRKEDLSMSEIDDALVAINQVRAASGRMFKRCIDIAVNAGCQEEYHAAADQLSILYRAMGWDVAALQRMLNDTVTRLYMECEASPS